MMWEGLPRFRWQCTLRTWAYALAHRAIAHTRRTQARRRHEVELSPAVQEVAHRVRTETLPFLRTQVKDRLARLRERLDPDDQTLLIMRFNRRLSWSEVARVMLGPEEPEPEAIGRAAATLRKRFERLKADLRAQADASS
jgi:RNA polymerase sigma-70 factor (ECF subfamily)